MANKYGKGMFEEYFHVNPEFSRMTEDFRPDTLRAKETGGRDCRKDDRLYRHRVYAHRV